tara:strand:+ start:3990 stop:4427 length:438 start_codon:yes stop_codon:yes gene_type:complete
MRLAIGNDHVGLELKLKLDEYFSKHKIDLTHFGAYDENRMHYPEVGFAVSKAVSHGDYDAGILICGTGIGMAIVANKVSGIRAVVCSEPYSAGMSREHNDSNILCLGARVVGYDLAEMILNTWLNTKYEGGRHQTRVDMINNYDK